MDNFSQAKGPLSVHLDRLARFWQGPPRVGSERGELYQNAASVVVDALDLGINIRGMDSAAGTSNTYATNSRHCRDTVRSLWVRETTRRVNLPLSGSTLNLPPRISARLPKGGCTSTGTPSSECRE